MNLRGTIAITSNWAQLNLDRGQISNGAPIEGFVVLMKDPMSPSPTSAERINAARQYFVANDGIHYTVSGQFVDSALLKYFLVANATQG